MTGDRYVIKLHAYPREVISLRRNETAMSTDLCETKAYVCIDDKSGNIHFASATYIKLLTCPKWHWTTSSYTIVQCKAKDLYKIRWGTLNDNKLSSNEAWSDKSLMSLQRR